MGTLRGLGIGFSNVAIADDTAFTMGNHAEREYVLAFSLVSGERLWSCENGPAYHNQYGDGPRATPTIDNDRLYALGASGALTCVDRFTGKRVWKRNILKDFAGVLPHWGISESVLIDNDRLICTPGGPGATMVALDKMTGEVVWKCASPEKDIAAYSSAIAATLGGVRQYVQYTASATIGVRAEDGKLLWRDTSSANGTANCCAAVAIDDMVVTASGYAKGGSMLRLVSNAGETTATLGWRSNDLQVQHGGLVLFADHIFAANEQALVCIELETGKAKWKARSVGKGSLTYADGRLIVRSEDGPIALVEASPAGYNELGRFIPPERSGMKSWTYPVVLNGKLLLRDQDLLFGYDMLGK
jgi:outer membrane protein assembly factor BamB